MSINKRKATRRTITTSGMVYDVDGKQIGPATIRNVSATGAQVEMATGIDLPAVFHISFARSGSVRRKCKKVWQEAALAGVQFVTTK